MADCPNTSFLIYKNAEGEYRWGYQASNIKTIASGEGNKTKLIAKHVLDFVKASYGSPVRVTSDAKA